MRILKTLTSDSSPNLRRSALPGIRIVIASVVLALASLTLTACSGNDPQTASEPTPAAKSSSAESQPAASGTCDYPEDPMGAAKEVNAPPSEPVATGNVSATIATSAGDLHVVLDGKVRPCTVNSFLSLAKQGYFDATNCHRLTTEGIWVLQCGDPTGTGTGGPGYSFADELTGQETYPAGTVAMANAGADTNGSQFFLVYKDSPLPPAYAVFGQMDSPSIRIVQKIGAAGTDNGGPDGGPKTPVTITAVTQR